jgi:hypothetical protein
LTTPADLLREPGEIQLVLAAEDAQQAGVDVGTEGLFDDRVWKAVVRG